MSKGVGFLTRARLLWRALTEVREQETAALDRMRKLRERTEAATKEMEENAAQSKAALANAFRMADEQLKSSVMKKAVLGRSLAALEDQARLQQQIEQIKGAASDPYERATAAAAKGMSVLQSLKKGEGAPEAPPARTPRAPR